MSAPAPAADAVVSSVHRTDRRTVTAWAFWDFGSAAFNAVLVTFIFSVYLTDSVGDSVSGTVGASTWYGVAMALGGAVIALTAPVVGRRSDARGRRRRAVRTWTLVTVALMAVLVVVGDDAPGYFWFGVTVMAVASVTFQFAEVGYFAMLNQVSVPGTVGRVSGFGWAMGYFGGIILLLLCYVGFIAGEGDTRGLLGLPVEDGWNVRAVALFAAVWFLVASLPLFRRIPEVPATVGGAAGVGWRDSYRALFRDLGMLWRTDRRAVWFLVASAVFRDGLAGVFTFGAILAVSVYGLSDSDVLLFGVGANVVAAVGALVAGRVDDRVGPVPVIAVSLVLMVADALVLFLVDGPAMFWVFGLVLCLFVGPAQSASRSCLSRMCPPGREGEMFGLYATTGRAVSWLAPAAFALFTGVSGSDRAGILGIALVLLAGVALLLRLAR
ncbi:MULTISPECIES: MFS transporter [Corynebacterium]|jgi:UMF1 family MFS transporter|uniref:MFS transporter n=1 Tax=Corynebacterium TaxID=1716 RepID=UPI00098FDC55|nr:MULTISPECIES: MFS transporter [Corynebacterium]MCI1255124.1 MFS transporter [Corynebacterium provencense]